MVVVRKNQEEYNNLIFEILWVKI